METSRGKPGVNGGSGSINGSSSRRAAYMGAAGVGSIRAAAGSAPPAADACSVALRAFVLAATLVAAIVMGVDRQTRTIQVTLASTLQPLQVPVTANWTYSSAFV
jgi:hypothetical protein